MELISRMYRQFCKYKFSIFNYRSIFNQFSIYDNKQCNLNLAVRPFVLSENLNSVLQSQPLFFGDPLQIFHQPITSNNENVSVRIVSCRANLLTNYQSMWQIVNQFETNFVDFLIDNFCHFLPHCQGPVNRSNCFKGHCQVSRLSVYLLYLL